MCDGGQLVFGYGSLVAGAPLRPAVLHGHRRVWGVAMDNSADLPGYKFYRRPEDGSRPAVFVAFLDIAEDASAMTRGALIAVDDALLRVLDARERNYDRVDVTAQVQGAAPGATVWTYRGSAAGRARLERGVWRGTAVVGADYVESVRAALQALGVDDVVDPGPLAPMGLERVDLPPPRAGDLVTPSVARASAQRQRKVAEAAKTVRGGRRPT